MSRTHRTRRLAHLALAGGLALAVAACGESDDGAQSSSGQTPVAVATSAVAANDAHAFCAAELAIEQASNDESADPTPLISAATEVVPPEISDAFHAVIAAFQAGDTESDAFTAPYAQLVGWVADNCGYAQVDAKMSEYAFTGVPGEIASGPTVFSSTNAGQEYHEMIVFRRMPGVADPVQDLLMLPDDELFTKITSAGGIGPTAQGATARAVVDLTPGAYFAVCFLPVGTTSAQQLEGLGPDAPEDPDGPPPHMTQGMIAEFTVPG